MLLGKTIKMIVAVSQNNVIGRDGHPIPWQGLVPSDIKRFKELTTRSGENCVIYGRKTWDSIPLKFRPLPSRQNIIISMNPEFKIEDKNVFVARNKEEAVEMANCDTVWIIGGSQIYREFQGHADEIHVTHIENKFFNENYIYYPGTFNNWSLITSSPTNIFRKVYSEPVTDPRDKLKSTYCVYK